MRSKQLALNILLTLLLFQWTNSLEGQTYQMIEGKIIDQESKEGLPFANVFVAQPSGELLGTTTTLEGTFQLEVPIGKHQLEVKYVGYGNYAKEINVKAETTDNYEITLTTIDKSPPWKDSEPFPEIAGAWEPIYKVVGGQTTEMPRKGWFMSFSSGDLPGKIGWNYSKTTSYHYRHIGDGFIEVKTKGLEEIILIYDKNRIESLILKIMAKLNKKKVKTTISKDRQTLELQIENEKYVFQKLHDNTFPETTTELFGNWKPINGQLNGKKVKNFAKNAQVMFYKKEGIPFGGFMFTEGKECSSGSKTIYQYLDSDFISFRNDQYQKLLPSCEKKCSIGSFFNYFFQTGCHIEYNRFTGSYTLSYADTFLELQKELEK